MRNRQHSASHPLAASPLQLRRKSRRNSLAQSRVVARKCPCAIAKLYAGALFPSPFCSQSHPPIQLLLNRSAVRLSVAFISASPGGVLRVALRRLCRLHCRFAPRTPRPPIARNVMSVYKRLQSADKNKNITNARKKSSSLLDLIATDVPHVLNG
jgi:hypothetical protein